MTTLILDDKEIKWINPAILTRYWVSPSTSMPRFESGKSLKGLWVKWEFPSVYFEKAATEVYSSIIKLVLFITVSKPSRCQTPPKIC